MCAAPVQMKGNHVQHGEVTGQLSESSNPGKASVAHLETPGQALIAALAGAGLTAECSSCGRRFPTLQEGLAHTCDRNAQRQPDTTTAALEREAERRVRTAVKAQVKALNEELATWKWKIWTAFEQIAIAAGCEPNLEARVALVATDEIGPVECAAREIVAQIESVKPADPAPHPEWFHGRCGGTIAREASGQRDTCRKCGASWRVKPSARPQSAWVGEP